MTMATAGGGKPMQGPARWRFLLCGLSGDVLEWCDFAVYFDLAAIIGHQFFPSDDGGGRCCSASAPSPSVFWRGPWAARLRGR